MGAVAKSCGIFKKFGLCAYTQTRRDTEIRHKAEKMVQHKVQSGIFWRMMLQIRVQPCFPRAGCTLL